MRSYKRSCQSQYSRVRKEFVTVTRATAFFISLIDGMASIESEVHISDEVKGRMLTFAAFDDNPTEC